MQVPVYVSLMPQVCLLVKMIVTACTLLYVECSCAQVAASTGRICGHCALAGVFESLPWLGTGCYQMQLVPSS